MENNYHIHFYEPQVTKTKTGKFQYVQRYSSTLFNGIKRATTTIEKNTALTRQKADKIVKEKIQKKFGLMTDSGITFKEMVDLSIKFARKRGRAYNTLESMRLITDKMNRKFGERRLSSISSFEINKYLNDLLYNKDMANGSVKNYVMFFNDIFKYALKLGYIQDNPMLRVFVDYKDETRKKMEHVKYWYLTNKELSTILNYCLKENRQDFYSFYLWLFLTGMRVGEAGAIQEQDIYYKDGMWFANVRGTLIHHTGTTGWIKQAFTKNESSMRSVVLPQQAVEIYLKNSRNTNWIKLDYFEFDNSFFKLRHFKNLLSSPTFPRIPFKNGFLFRNKLTKHPFNRGTISRSLNRIRKYTSINKPITSHIFRHTHISTLAAQGYPLKIIADRVGHKDIDTTKLIYLHVIDEQREKYNKKIKNFEFLS